MIDNRILIDITHMSDTAMDQTFALSRERDPDGRVPVIATHMACRLGSLSYNLTDKRIEEIKERNGLLGLIACEHYISDGADEPQSFEQSFALLCRHIDRICQVTESEDHVAFGTDIDGYIKPALPGLEHLGRMGALQTALAAKYGAVAASKFSSENALRVIRAGWK